VPATDRRIGYKPGVEYVVVTAVGTVSGNIVDVVARRIYPGTVKVVSGRIVEIVEDTGNYDTYIVPGFVDSHVHVESSMLTPSEFARAAVVHGTVACVCDPHEIANVLGVEGVKYMLEDAKKTPLKFLFGAPSCVPASPYESNGASLGPDEVRELLAFEDIGYLAEVMNYPGVLSGDPALLAKIDAAKAASKPVDGHAPGLVGEDARRYFGAGISTDHECYLPDEAKGKLALGVKVQIREGSAARNFDDIIRVCALKTGLCMFASDDKHPHDLLRGHINELVSRAIKAGVDPFDALSMATLNPIRHYCLGVGLLQKGDPADYVVVGDLREFKPLKTVIGGVVVAEDGAARLKWNKPRAVNRFEASRKRPDDFKVPWKGGPIKVIGVLDGQLLTEELTAEPKTNGGHAVADASADILKIAVVNRYRDAKPAVGFIKGFGLREGAIASSVAHDSHNIVAVGASDETLSRAVNLIIDNRGGISAAAARGLILPLPIAGLMSDQPADRVAEAYIRLDAYAKSLGCRLAAPYMTLSFMALPVIPKLKMTDRGLFDGQRFKPVGLAAEQD
jgi:adenine deaminase